MKKDEINAISSRLKYIAELSLRTTWHTTCCSSRAPDVLHVICTRLCLSVAGSSRKSEEMLQNLDWYLSVSLLSLLLSLLSLLLLLLSQIIKLHFYRKLPEILKYLKLHNEKHKKIVEWE